MKKTWLMKLTVKRLLMLIPFCYPLFAHSQTTSKLLDKFRPLGGKIEECLESEDIWELPETLQEQDDFQKRLRGSIEFGFDGDSATNAEATTKDAEEEALYRVNSIVGLQQGNYPTEFRFDSLVKVQLKDDGEFVEDVTAFRINYDYHPDPMLEMYTFVERFSDNFLSIDQRWEIGGGVYFRTRRGLTPKGEELINKLGPEIPIKPRKPKESASKREHGKYKEKKEVYEKWFGCVTKVIKKAERRHAFAGRSRPDADDWNELGKLQRSAENGIRKRYSVFDGGIAVSALVELEKATVQAIPILTRDEDGVPKMVSDPIRFSIPGEQRVRLTLRPTLHFQPSDWLEIKTLPYLKYALDEPTRVVPPGETEPRRDLRIDWFTSLEWKLSEADAESRHEFSFTANFYYLKDYGPPRIPNEMLEEAGRRLMTEDWDRTVANDVHKFFQLNFKIRWGGS